MAKEDNGRRFGRWIDRSAASALSAVLLLASADARAEHVAGRVVSVADGDTLTVLAAHHRRERVRLAAIDAPERGQPYFRVSRQALARRVAGCEVDVDTHKRDRYGRLVGKVSCRGVDVGLAQVDEGLAWHYKDYQREQSVEDRAQYSAAEEHARAVRAGIWSGPAPTPPWEVRRR